MLLDEKKPHTVDDLVERSRAAYGLSDSYGDVYTSIAASLSKLVEDGYIHTREVLVPDASPALRFMTRYHAFVHNGRMGVVKKHIGLACLAEVREGILQASRYRETVPELLYFKISEPDFDSLHTPHAIPEPALF